ncbi:SAM-dependent methyltransferase [Rhizobium leguminosarum]|uniref:SAM-dependent methyltransferase n=1 Tax=Rhizobium leguminosarum TaxID=384 RepID=UPI0013EF5278|nr:SAM-dependent methyltransferase [Rhizobium leguminosarum]
MKEGSLTIVGSGITAISHFTMEAALAIRLADVTFYIVADALTEGWIIDNARSCSSLADLYVEGQHRAATYEGMTRTIVEAVKAGNRVCAIFYGHPGVFVNPSHAAVRELQIAGYPVSMQAGVSAEDCLFADLGFDPSTNGCLSMEATNFLIYERHIEPSVALVLWQIGMVGDPTHNPRRTVRKLDCLVEKMLRYYPKDHHVCIYEAPIYNVSHPRRDWCHLELLPDKDVTGISTLYVPAFGKPQSDSYFISKLDLVVSDQRPVQFREDLVS